MEATVAERGQITLPKAVRDALGLTKGSKLKVELEGGRIVMRKDVDDAISRVRGRVPLPAGTSTDDIMRELRGRAPGDPVPDWDQPAAAGAAEGAGAGKARQVAKAGKAAKRARPGP